MMANSAKKEFTLTHEEKEKKTNKQKQTTTYRYNTKHINEMIKSGV